MRLIKNGNDSDSPAVDDWGDGAAAPPHHPPTFLTRLSSYEVLLLSFGLLVMMIQSLCYFEGISL